MNFNFSHDRLLINSSPTWWGVGQVVEHGHDTSSTLSSQGHLLRVTSESGDFLLDPLKGQLSVRQTKIARSYGGAQWEEAWRVQLQHKWQEHKGILCCKSMSYHTFSGFHFCVPFQLYFYFENLNYLICFGAWTF